jgi:transcriptional regulator with XRE-family HTH domain
MREKKELNVEIGHRIQIVREQRRYTQEQFAELLDVGIQHISNIERGVNGVSLATLKKICEVLDISADYLLLGKESSQESFFLSQQLHKLPAKQSILIEQGFSAILRSLEMANQSDDS